MKTLFTSEVVSHGGRSGFIEDSAGLLNITLGNPLQPGSEKSGPNPEHLFAGAYAACYHSALVNAGEKLGTPVKGSILRAKVSLLEDDKGGYNLGVELHAKIPGLDQQQTQRIMEQAHTTCPYSKALRGEAEVKLVADR